MNRVKKILEGLRLYRAWREAQRAHAEACEEACEGGDQGKVNDRLADLKTAYNEYQEATK
ncbi:MAG: hypothetical protein FJ014_13265 [Chloroflexi bacterium]|nr:hypothetical protein [Chloroflexota bacterium]